MPHGREYRSANECLGTSQLVAVFEKSSLVALRIGVPIVVVVALALVEGALTAGIADSTLAPSDPLATEVMSVVMGGLNAGVATSSPPELN